MKNVKLTLATTLSVLAMAFSGLASAETISEYSDYKHNYKLKNVTKSVKTKVVNQKVVKHETLKRDVLNKRVSNRIYKNQLAKRVVLKQSPRRSVLLNKDLVKKSAKTKYVSNESVNQAKQFNQRISSESRYKSNKQFQRHARVNANNVANQIASQVKNQAVYSVRSGDTLIQVAFKTGISVPQLAKLNRISDANLNNLKIGQVLRLG